MTEDRVINYENKPGLKRFSSALQWDQRQGYLCKPYVLGTCMEIQHFINLLLLLPVDFYDKNKWILDCFFHI